MILTNLDAARPAGARRSPSPAVETCRRLEAAVLDGKLGEFARLLESALMLPQPLAEKIAADNSGEPIVVAAKALGMSNAALQSDFAADQSVDQSVGRSVSMNSPPFTTNSARTRPKSMIEIWRGDAPRRRGTNRSACGTTRSVPRARRRRVHAIKPTGAATRSPPDSGIPAASR